MKTGLNNNQLKIIALIAMTCDHLGKQVFPDIVILQIVGRLAFPIFAYMIAEGCCYTRNMKKYFGMTAAVALVCQIIYFVAMGSLYMCVMVTFSLSIVLIALIKEARKRKSVLLWLVFGLAVAVTFFLCTIVPNLPTGTDFYIDYGIIGVMLPVVIYVYEERLTKLVATSLMLVLLGTYLGGVQWWGLLSVPFLAVYNGCRGKMHLKYIFYVYYPVHLGVIYLISLVL
ncbi:MAG: hypothetical protein IJB96_02370 [Lachnospira sp.]|nr:hypothetical protein [Lachnospira sp.]